MAWGIRGRASGAWDSTEGCGGFQVGGSWGLGKEVNN